MSHEERIEVLEKKVATLEAQVSEQPRVTTAELTFSKELSQSFADLINALNKQSERTKISFNHQAES